MAAKGCAGCAERWKLLTQSFNTLSQPIESRKSAKLHFWCAHSTSLPMLAKMSSSVFRKAPCSMQKIFTMFTETFFSLWSLCVFSFAFRISHWLHDSIPFSFSGFASNAFPGFCAGCTGWLLKWPGLAQNMSKLSQNTWRQNHMVSCFPKCREKGLQSSHKTQNQKMKTLKLKLLKPTKSLSNSLAIPLGLKDGKSRGIWRLEFRRSQGSKVSTCVLLQSSKPRSRPCKADSIEWLCSWFF